MRSPPLTRALSATLVVASLALSAAPAHGGIPAGRYAIGDSVMLGAREALIARGIRVNAHVSRQFDDAAPLIRKLAARRLPANVIVHLGTNGMIDGADCDALVRAAGRGRHVYLVTVKVPRDYRDTNNARLRACARRHQNASVIDWYGLSRYRRAWFYGDGYHLRPIGQREYARLIDQSV